jgi:hypothetical protein
MILSYSELLWEFNPAWLAVPLIEKDQMYVLPSTVIDTV